MSQRTPVNRLSIYLIKADYSEHRDILKNPDDLKSKALNGIGILYFGESHAFEPSWIRKFFGTSLGKDLDLFNASSKAVLLTEVAVSSNERRIFAIPFGYGWTFLNPGTWEERFGLKVTLNAVDPSHLRRIHKKNMSSVPKDASEQLSREGVAADFGIDIEQDLIQSVTGKPKDGKFGKTVTGKDSLSLSVKVNLFDIKDFLKDCYERFASDDYKEDFGWIDQISEIKNPNTIKRLNDEMIDNIKRDRLEKIWMAVPELVDWSDVLGFSFRNKKVDLREDIILSQFLQDLPESEKSNLDHSIFNRHIYCFSSSSEELKYQWKAYNCLYCEIHDDKKEKTYLLSNGKWYEVAKEFAKRVDREYQHLRDSRASVYLPSYTHRNEKEYNQKTAKGDVSFYCMDGDLIPHGGGYSKIEFCDLFTRSKEIIHVKQYGGSAVLSHLFSQGVVSGELLVADSDFRKKVNDKLPNSHKIGKPNVKLNPSDYHIIFAIISSSAKPLEIPFFSKVSLRNAKRRLETFGYKVSLQKINAE
ncbi:MAG: hypothetical protein C4532_15910 [Candidatus Abyssobacteria bacterium SURF_17]|uniref:Sporadically distributed protein, TIGR04141 family n=1 Tax=Candidatus Abyssobacteria bacterium SURF_17 TaxID=2093361 RepID=A0A419ESH8_9BACT|nr:MAG: hypothetical protein C4532_15910 [Candidatus Abyssubacteria bacterium SURF_17]